MTITIKWALQEGCPSYSTSTTVTVQDTSEPELKDPSEPNDLMLARLPTNSIWTRKKTTNRNNMKANKHLHFCPI